jgi:hypothetical protein
MCVGVFPWIRQCLLSTLASGVHEAMLGTSELPGELVKKKKMQRMDSTPCVLPVQGLGSNLFVVVTVFNVKAFVRFLFLFFFLLRPTLKN